MGKTLGTVFMVIGAGMVLLVLNFHPPASVEPLIAVAGIVIFAFGAMLRG